MPFLSDIRAMILAALLAACLIFGIVQTVRIEGVGIWPIKIVGLQDKYDAALLKLVAARAELKAISTKRNEQRETTDRNIRQSQKYIQNRDKVAERIEKAPLPGNCVTPPEILGADI